VQKQPQLKYFLNEVSDFLSNINDVPLWMTISWTSQMMALLDKSESVYIMDFLHKLAAKYPQEFHGTKSK